MAPQQEEKLKLYVDCPSPPSRALVIFCRANGIEAQEVQIDIMKRQTRSPEFKKINPMGLLPCIDDDGFRLFERYPKDPKKRALVDAALDWFHLGLRRHSAQLLRHGVYVTLPPLKHGFFPEGEDHEALAAEAVHSLQTRAFEELESVLLLEDGKFLQGAEEVSLADLSLACEIKQLELLDSELHKKLLESRERIATWMSEVEAALQPHFSDVHAEFSGICKYVDSLRAQGDC